MTLHYVGGPKDGETYPLEKGQVLPLSIRANEWRHEGHYVLVKGPTPTLRWVGK